MRLKPVKSGQSALGQKGNGDVLGKGADRTKAILHQTGGVARKGRLTGI